MHLAGLWLLAPLVIGPAPSPAPACGATVTADVTLHADLIGCAGDGLVVAADGITVNLGGHLVAGTRGEGSAGVRVAGRHRVTVTGGRIQGFDVGVYAGGSSGTRVEAVTATANEQGVTLDGGGGNQVRGNRLTGNADNLIVAGSGNTVSGNVIAGATGCGDGCGYGISLEAGARNLIEGNQIRGGRVDGIRVASYDPDAPTRDTTVRGNVVLGPAGDGISVGVTGDFPATGTTVSGNLVADAGGDGIAVATTPATATANVAAGNGGYGITAVAGTGDGGRNRAYGNRGPAQCLRIRC
jgi:parallel beta-helix repeat protein